MRAPQLNLQLLENLNLHSTLCGLSEKENRRQNFFKTCKKRKEVVRCRIVQSLRLLGSENRNRIQQIPNMYDFKFSKILESILYLLNIKFETRFRAQKSKTSRTLTTLRDFV